ncbi:MAG TPA: hypothetical protein VJW20_01365 [Candidatus Angelobacter sp.]|nr:hypothetical protein [Candidatus Angelobacter sp.]
MSSQSQKTRWLLSQQLNFTFLAGVGVFCYLTRNTRVLPFVVVIEIWYWVLYGPLCDWSKHLRGKLPVRLRNLRWQPLLSWLLLMISILFVVVPAEHVKFRGIAFDLTYERWEIAGLTWNLIFSSICYFITWPLFKRQGCMLIYLTCLGIAVSLTIGAILSLAPRDDGRAPDYQLHLLLVMLVAICFVLVDIVICFDCPPEKERALKALFYADLPTLCALAILFAILFKAPHPSTLNTFLSGAIAFQFIANSLAFAFIEGGISTIFVLAEPPLGTPAGGAPIRDDQAQTVALGT